MHASLKILAAAAPVALLLAAAHLLQGQLALISPTLFRLTAWAPFAMLALGLALALRFNRSRVFFSIFTLLLAYLVLWHRPLHNEFALRALYGLLCLLLPLNLLAFSLLQERGIFTRRGAQRFAVLGVELLLGAWLLVTPQEGVAHYLFWPLFDHPLVHWTPLSQPGLLAFLVAFVWLNGRMFVQPSAQPSALFGTLLAVLAVMQQRGDPSASVAYFGAAGAMLVFAVIQESYSMAYLDELTGLPGRRALQEELLKLGSRYAIAMVDVDHFKRFNDTHGHDAGDQVLRMVAARLREVTGGGKAFRYGGEEFSIVFAGKEAAEVAAHLEALRADVAASRFALRRRERRRPESGAGAAKPKSVAVTVSMGVAGPGEDAVTPGVVLRQADRALYRAKKQGRNRVVAA